MSDSITPLRQQYLDIKKNYPNAIVFFRLGDFYETFDEDAKITARELDIVLTSRPVSKGVRVPMAGIPHHAVENYLSRLIDKGYHVAICEQVGDQPVASGLFPREVVRTITPGTIFEPALLNSPSNNYLAALFFDDKKAGIAHVDITTGEFAVTELDTSALANAIRAEISRLKPAEVLMPASLPTPEGLPGFITPYESWHFEEGRCEARLKAHFAVASLDGFGLKGKGMAIRTAGAILQYLEETQKTALKLLVSLTLYHVADYMVLDAETRRNLELTETIRGNHVDGSLLGILDQTRTPMGKRLLRQWVSKPLLNLKEINTRQDFIAFFVGNGFLRAQIINLLKDFDDVERLTNRIISGSAMPRDLAALRENLQMLPTLKAMLPDNEPVLAPILDDIHLCQDQLALIKSAIADEPPATLANTGIVRAGYSAELDGVIAATQHAREWIDALEENERQRTGIRTLKVGYNKVFGYYIEVTHANSQSVPDDYIRKQTLVNNERYITPALKEYETLVLNAEEQIHEIELRLFKTICAELAAAAKYLLTTAQAIARLDVLTALAECAALYNFTRPEMLAEKCLMIKDGRHTVVEHLLRNEQFIANDTIFEQGEIIRIITGPNMSGKSTFLRQVALIVLMAQMGSFVPASHAKIGLVDRIFTRIGAQDEIHSGQSTFMVEMIETANILHNATARSLLILDAIGRGTSTYDGLSIAWAIVEYLHNHPNLKPFTLFATHYHELITLADLLPGVHNYNVAVSESDGRVIFLHKIIAGGSDRSYGIHVAQLAGLPNTIIQRAHEILQKLEAEGNSPIHPEPVATQQLTLFPENNPVLDALKEIDINAISPIEALNQLYDLKRRFLKS